VLIIIIIIVVALIVMNLKPVKNIIDPEVEFGFDFVRYAIELANMESSWNYTIINSVGAMGKYQFMPSTVRGLFKKYTLPDWKNPEHFTTSANAPDIQEAYFFAFVTDNLATYKRRNLNQFVGNCTKGRLRFAHLTSRVNIYGIMAGGHLGGMRGVENYLKGKSDADDGLTSISDYVTLFSSKLT